MMGFAKNNQRRSGFTLVELCVAMAICAIVGTMVVTFIVFATKQKAEITNESKRISDTTEVQAAVNSWLKKYDSESYTISSSDSTSLTASNSDGTPAGVISFNTTGRKMIIDNVPATEELNNIRSIGFNRPTHTYTVDNHSVTENEQVIKITVTYTDGNTQTLLFPLFSDTVRQRKVEKR